MSDAFLAVLDGDGHGFELFDDVFNRLIHTVLHVQRIDAGDDGFHAFVEDGFGEDRGGGGTVADDVARFGGDFANHLGAHVFVSVFKVDFFGDRDAVFSHERRTEALLNDDVTTARSKGNLDGAREFRHAATERFTSVLIESNHFRHNTVPYM